MGDQLTEAPQGNPPEPTGDKKSAARTATPSSAYLPSYGPYSSLAAGAPDAPPLTRGHLLFLQRTVGNRAVTRILRKAIQRKCACGADAGAHEKCAGCRDGQQSLQRRAEGAAEPSSSLPSSVSQVMQSGGGESLPRSTREQMGGLFGADLAGVRVHTGSQAADAARDINAHAFTVGQDIYFGAGQYQPDTRQGQHLLAHELTHTVQQTGGQSALQSHPLVSQPDDALEREAEEKAGTLDRASPAAAASPEPSASARPRPANAPLVQRSWYDPFVGAAEWVGGKVASGAKAVAGEARRIGGAALECFGAVGSSVSDLVFGSVSVPGKEPDSLQDLMGAPKPTGEEPPGILDTILSVVKHPCVQMIPGYTLMASVLSNLSGVSDFLHGAWRVMQNPGVLFEAIYNKLGELIAEVPGKVDALMRGAITFSDPPPNHLEGIGRHLEPKLRYLKDNWWEVLKETGQDMLWPWPGVWKDLQEVWEHIKGAASNIWDLDFGGATDHLLAVWRTFNTIAGRLYGWFFIASVLVGAVIGAFFGGAGAIPGAAAGAAFAVEVGEVLLISTIAAETASLLKAGSDLVFKDQTEEEQEDDYEQIANSSLILGIIGAMYLLGVIASRLGKGIISRVVRPLGRRALKLLRTRPLGLKSIVVDENILIALEKRAAGEALQTGEKRMLEFVDKNPDAQLTVSEELYNKRLAANKDVSNLKVIKGTPARGGPEYDAFIKELETNKVGAGKGAEDRRLIADTIFAETEPGATPTFATHDAGIYKRLATMAGHDLRTLGGSVPEKFPNGFEVVIKGRKLKVIPLPNK